MVPNINMVGDLESTIPLEHMSVLPLPTLTEDQRKEAWYVISQASQILERPILPEHQASLERKYQRVVRAATIYVFGILEENRKEIRGCQGWNTQMALMLGKNLYVYDEITLQWYKGDTFLAWLPTNNNVQAVREVNRFKPCERLHVTTNCLTSNY